MLFFARQTRKALRMLTLLGSLVLTIIYLFHYLSSRDKSNLDDVQYVVLILGGPETFEQRTAARQTWFNLARNIRIDNGTPVYEWKQRLAIVDQNANAYKDNLIHSSHNVLTMDRLGQDNIDKIQTNFVRFYFTIGTKNLSISDRMKLHYENMKYKDLLLLDNLIDKYENLTPKMLKSLVWISKSFKSLKYLVKSDLDAFVRIDLIIKETGVNGVDVNSLVEVITYKDHSSNPKGVYWGYFVGGNEVKSEGKWREDNWFLCDKYFPYTVGSGYVLSKSVVDYIARNAQHLSQYYCEDVSMGVWTAALDIRRIHDIRFESDHGSPRRCNKHVLVSHTTSIHNLYELYNNLLYSRGEKLCTVEYVKTSYLYLWDEKPSLCCYNVFCQYYCEDVSMGVWTAALDIRRIHDIRFESDHGSPRRCNKHVLVSHTKSIHNLYELYNNLLYSRGEKLCTFEYVKTSYLYLWDEKPSFCCYNMFW